MDNNPRGSQFVTIDGEEYEMFFTMADLEKIEPELSQQSVFMLLTGKINLKDTRILLETGVKGLGKLDRLPSNLEDIMVAMVKCLAFVLGQDLPEESAPKKKKPKRKARD